MDEFDGLDLQSVEERLDTGEGAGAARITLGVLDGTTPPEEWVETVGEGSVLVLNVEGDLNELASTFAREIQEAGGELMHFRDFLIIAPPGVGIDANRLG